MVFAKEKSMVGADYGDMFISEYSHSFSHITFRLQDYDAATMGLNACPQ